MYTVDRCISYHVIDGPYPDAELFFFSSALTVTGGSNTRLPSRTACWAAACLSC